MQIWDSPPPVKLVAQARFQGARVMRWHQHPFYELGVVLTGGCSWRLDGRRRRVPLQAGESILLRPGTLHCETSEEKDVAQVAWVGFDFEGEAPVWANRVVALGEDFTEVAGYLEVLTREHHQQDEVSRVRVGLAAQSILLLAGRQARGDDGTVAKAARTRSGLNPRQLNCVESAAHYFRTNLADPLEVSQVAAYYSLCPAHFTSLFRRHHRRSPQQFLREARLERAVDLLRTSPLGLKEIASLCGYVDAAHLCKVFKAERGTTPRAYRLRAIGR